MISGIVGCAPTLGIAMPVYTCTPPRLPAGADYADRGYHGQAWNPANHWYGAMRTPANAERCRREASRLDVELLTARPKWAAIEQDDSRGRALPEHYEAYELQRASVFEQSTGKIVRGSAEVRFLSKRVMLDKYCGDIHPPALLSADPNRQMLFEALRNGSLPNNEKVL